MNDLNEKLAKWVGEVHYDSADELYYHIGGHKFYSDEVEFTYSLDLCFDYLVPKLLEGRNKYWLNSFFFSWVWHWMIHEPDTEPALALCKAIEKLIDGVEE